MTASLSLFLSHCYHIFYIFFLLYLQAWLSQIKKKKVQNQKEVFLRGRSGRRGEEGWGVGERMFGLGVSPRRRAGWEGPEEDVGSEVSSLWQLLCKTPTS